MHYLDSTCTETKDNRFSHFFFFSFLEPILFRLQHLITPLLLSLNVFTSSHVFWHHFLQDRLFDHAQLWCRLDQRSYVLPIYMLQQPPPLGPSTQ